MTRTGKIFRFAGLALFVAMVVIQFFRPEKNVSTVPSPDDLLARREASPEVRRLLAAACYDCHSDHTRYPWYSEIQPVAWWLADHVADGKRELNFSRFDQLSLRRQAARIGACIDNLETKEMPLPSYTWTHRDARLSAAEVKTLTAWFESVLDDN
jgi:hypothetical protein